MSSDPNVVVALPAFPERASAVRGTVLMSSQASLRSAGHFDTYASKLEDEYRSKLLVEIVPNVWLGMDQAMAHYRACEALGLTQVEIQAMGAATGDRINSVFVKSLVRLATGTLQPWFAWGLAPRVWARAWKGSAIGVRKVGPKDARVDVVGFPCASIPYVRVAIGSFFAKNTQLFCRSAEARAVRPVADPSESLSYLVSWV